LGNITASGGPPGQVNYTTYPGGQIPQSQLDPNMQNLMRQYPQPNADPNATGGYNYVQAQTFNQNNTQWMTRVDYSISDNTKLFVRYNYQRETQQFPVGLWWRQTDQVPYPTPVQGKNRSDSISASLTHVFSPTLTNEFVFGYTFIGFPNVFEDPAKVDRTNVGYNYTGLYKNGVSQIPSFGGFGWTAQEAAVVFNPGGFEAGGATQGLYANKYMPSFSDTVSKVWGTHTVKFGFFYEWIRNAQPANNNTNGNLNVWINNSNTLGNEYADLVTGNLYQYNEASFNRINDIAYTTIEGFVQDSWKVSRRLTLELGLRMTHMTPWSDREGYGYSIFDYSQYSSSCQPSDYCGFLWHSKDPSVPLGGFPTRALFWQPRLGAAYDLTGKGNTVLRGGWGRFYYHAGQFTAGLDVSAGVQNVTIPNNGGPGGTPLYARDLDTLNFSSAALSPAAVDSTDDKQAYTDSYSFTVSQRLPWSSLLEVAYVGNRTNDIPSSGNGGSAGFNTKNINLVPVGAMLDQGVDPNSLNADNFRPLQGFSNLFLATNNSRANYNALQVTWVRSRARWNVSANYTYGKAMGIVGSNGNLGDQFNIDNNYGVLSSNRTHIFNAAYSVELGNPVKGNKIAGGVVNGWQVSGILQWQSGANLSGYQNQNFGMSLNASQCQTGEPCAAWIPGTEYNISNQSLLGTNNIQLNPVQVCDPTSNLGPNQYINGSCFAAPSHYYENGPTVMKPIYGPAFFNWDMGLFKNFQIKEQMKLQFRFNAYNFMNHPLWSFPSTTNLTLGFDGRTGQLNTPNFGITTEKQGHRVLQLALKFYF
jgi:hypothetical protein